MRFLTSYAALFLINLITPSLILTYPIRAWITMNAAANHNIWLVIMTATIASTIGLLPIYELARRANEAEQERHLNNAAWTVSVLTWVEKMVDALPQKVWLTIAALNFLPVPDMLGCIFAGRRNYPRRLFLLAAGGGRFVHILVLTGSTVFVQSLLPPIPPWVQDILTVVNIIVMVIVFIFTVPFLIGLVQQARQAKPQPHPN